MTPKQVADYARKDSKALSLVSTTDLVAELKFRLMEGNNLTKADTGSQIESLAKDNETHQNQELLYSLSLQFREIPAKNILKEAIRLYPCIGDSLAGKRVGPLTQVKAAIIYLRWNLENIYGINSFRL